jgi:hypothetical protein
MTLPFSHTDYDKLDRKVFPTVRRRDKFGDVGDINTVRVGARWDREDVGEAIIIAKETVTLQELTGPFIQFDTQSETTARALETINEFYRNPIEMDEELTLYWNKWVNDE